MNYNRRHKEFAYKNIKELVEDGIENLKRKDLSDEGVQRWLDYSQKIVEICTKDFDSSIFLNYLRVLLSVQSKDMSAYQKINVCLDYLLEVLRIIIEKY